MTIPLLISWLFFIISIYSSLLSLVVVCGQCVSDQQSLLLQLKDSLVFDATWSQNLVQWNESSDCCNWPGITCEEGHVTGLKLSNESISGGIDHNSTLFNLVYLKSLDLSFNDLSSTIPSRIGNLTQLVSLDLSSNNFTGSIPSFSMSKNLTEINLSHNHLIGPISSVRWEGLQNLVNVDLKNNSLRGNIPSSLFSIPSMEQVDLSYNQFSGQVLEFSVTPASMLHSVDLSNKQLEGPIPMSFFKSRKIRYLTFCSNKFNGITQLDMIQVDAWGHLSDLDLSNNQLYGEIPSWIWKVVRWPSCCLGWSILTLNLSHNHLVGMQEPYSLGNLSKIDLSFNQLQGKIPILPQRPMYIDFSDNHFTSSIPLDIGKHLSSTFYFSLSNNNLTGIIPESICNGSAIRLLDLSNNSFSGRIPTCMLAMSSIVGVSLRMNNLNGSFPDVFPVGCTLTTLDLSTNQLTGRIPKSLTNCRTLEVLNLGNNQMLDTFPLFLKNISTLRVLILLSNKFYGSIACPKSSGDYWPDIQIVHVASNNFSGELPGQCLTKWLAMVVEDVDLTPIGGDSLANNKVRPIWYGYNYANSLTVTNKGLEMEMVKIPKGFTYIDFSSNNFNGEIPKELGQLKSLIVLNFSHNALSGQIPSSFGNLQRLESLDLSRNHLNEEIPASLSNLNFLQVLDLSHNQLIGRIPKGSQLQTFSADSFQGNDGLCGPPSASKCRDEEENTLPETPHEDKRSNSGNDIKWDLIGAEVGFIVGFVSEIAPLVFYRRWRKCYFDCVEDIAFRLLPQPLLKKWLSRKIGIQSN